ncbi:peroxide stress protein YaaA [Streptomyces sp. RB6PN25]|uniref:Peroxide stress protein YaaA n=1 Tax=Streptomyces humicola TaxID=2953240 RepID=A0ABT1PWU8_9ACTN|nr:peroxide stress protein YaaA [Streptomyces humicola]MCQ4082153.1 peroxide stress protein YaaA [Streptomyces humicola]
MLVLLPPSEGKSTPGSGPVLDLGGLSLPGLNPAREVVLDELVGLCAGDEEKALEVLGLGAKLRGEVAKNAGLRTAPTLRAGEVYTGVLYDALGLGTLSAAAKRRAGRSLLVFSGLWGAVRIGDRIPSYRCSMGVKLPGLGALGAYWRGAMAEVMPEAAGGGLVLDLRSAAYAAAWKPKGEIAGRTATVRVLQVTTVDGVEKRSVVSHFNKATKGRLVRALLEDGARPRNPGELAEALRDLGFAVEEQAPGKLDVLVTEIH